MSYNIPRNVKGEGRILYIFSYKAVLYTGAGILIGLLFYFLFSAIGLDVVGYVFVGVFGLIGFSIGTFKMPSVTFIKASKLVAGEKIDEVIKRGIRFKMNKVKYYVYSMDEQKNKITEDKDGGKKNGK